MLKQQIKANLLAIISLVVALTALSYNTWRNELTEHNRNVRAAGFEMLLHLGELQRITYLVHYDMALDRQSPRDGWVEVMVLRDLAEIMPPPVPESAGTLHKTWSDQWEGLGAQSEDAVISIENAADDLRKHVLLALRNLD